MEYDFEHKFHDLIYFEVGNFSILLKLIIYLRPSSLNFVENHKFNVNLFYLKQNLNNYLFNITYMHTTCAFF